MIIARRMVLYRTKTPKAQNPSQYVLAVQSRSRFLNLFSIDRYADHSDDLMDLAERVSKNHNLKEWMPITTIPTVITSSDDPIYFVPASEEDIVRFRRELRRITNPETGEW